MGLGLSSDGSVLYIADSGSHRIRQLRVDVADPSNSTVETLAGNGFRGFSGDGGRGPIAQLSEPVCVTEDLNRMVWICDKGNNRIRVVSLEIRIQIPNTNRFD